jgi:hypothetical protein
MSSKSRNRLVVGALHMLIDIADARAQMALTPDIMVSVDLSEGRNLPGQQVAASVGQIEHGLGVIAKRMRARIDADLEGFLRAPFGTPEEASIHLLMQAFMQRAGDARGATPEVARPVTDDPVMALALLLLRVGEIRTIFAGAMQRLVVEATVAPDAETIALLERGHNLAPRLDEIAHDLGRRVRAGDLQELARRPLDPEQVEAFAQAAPIAIALSRLMHGGAPAGELLN